MTDDRGAETDAVVERGMWHADSGQDQEVIVRFEDAEGVLVAQPLPAGIKRAIEDAEEPCPACEAVAWVEVGGAVCCERCGWMLFGPPGPDLEIQIVVAHGGFETQAAAKPGRDERRRRREAARAAVTFPVYARVGKQVRLSGSSGPSPDVRTSFHVDQEEFMGDRVSVETSLLSTVSGTLRDELVHLLDRMDWAEERSELAQQIQLSHGERVARRTAANTPIETRELVIDGDRQPFRYVAAGDDWIATREHGEVQVTVTGSRGARPEHVALSPIADLEHPENGTVADLEVVRRRESGELPTRSEVCAWIDEAGLSAHCDAILDSIAPAYRLQPTSSSPHRIGGLPDLAPGETWPLEHGIPLTLILQLDCSQLPALSSEFGAPPSWGHRGELLRVFAWLDMTMPEPDRAVVLGCSPDAPLAPAELPPRPDPLPDWAWEPEDESLRMLKRQPVRVVPCLTVDFDPYDSGLDKGEIEACERLHERITAGPLHAQLLGAARTMQGEDPRGTGPFVLEERSEQKAPDWQSVADEDAWTVLAHLADHPEMSFGDGGSLSIVIPLDDLAAGRYHRVITDPSMG